MKRSMMCKRNGYWMQQPMGYEPWMQQLPMPYEWMPYGAEPAGWGGMWTPDRDRDRQEQRDLEYWQQLYPSQTRQIQREVEKQCDLLEYNGSVMYDEYPDRIALAQVCEAVYQAVAGNDMGKKEGMKADPADKEMPVIMQHQTREPRDRTLQNLIEVLLFGEMHRRRHRHHRSRW